MFEDLSDDDKYQLGLLIGQSICGLFEMVAKIDGITFEEAVSRWVESYIAEKIIQATGESDATAG